MKLAAQRVLQPATGEQAIHMFYFRHDPYIWVGAPPPGLGHGVLVDSHAPLGGGGNHVLSYLDIVAPDDTPSSTIQRALAYLYDRQPSPLRETIGSCTFEWRMVSAYRLVWRAELARLYSATVAIRNRFDRVRDFA